MKSVKKFKQTKHIKDTTSSYIASLSKGQVITRVTRTQQIWMGERVVKVVSLELLLSNKHKIDTEEVGLSVNWYSTLFFTHFQLMISLLNLHSHPLFLFVFL